MNDLWSKGLRGGDLPPVTPRGARGPKTTASGTSEKAKTGADKQTPQSTGTVPAARLQQTPTLRRVTPVMVDSSELPKPESPSKPPSVYSGDGDDMTEEFELNNDSVRVFVRVRPPTKQEVEHEKHQQCLSVIGSKTLQLAMKEKQLITHKFVFDQVLPEGTTQQTVFELSGLVAVDNCLAGYNSSIFAYGQTGAGKTFTVIGNMTDAEKRGLAPRVFEYLYQKITENENSRGPDTVKYNCRCSFLEIYNETIADLLCASSTNLPIREDPETGPYVENLSEPNALNADEMLAHLVRGAENRHTGETRLNRESSRSHSVFMCTVEKTVTSNGISKCFYAKLNLVDLAGSERIASGAHGGSAATGEHFKEACHINKSLTALGRVTTELVKLQKSGGIGHVPYRDSKLTFLLQSSLGGNAKTLIIANVSPSSICASETLSTLRFAKQTKHIRNDAKVNWTVQGDRMAMQREIERLRLELASMRREGGGPLPELVAANEELTAQLLKEQRRCDEVQQERERIVTALNQARRENKVLDGRLSGLTGLSSSDGGRVGALAATIEQLEGCNANSWRILEELAHAEKELLQMQLSAESEEKRNALVLLSEAETGRTAAQMKCESLSSQLDALLREKGELEDGLAVMAANFASASEQLEVQRGALAEQAAELAEARAAHEAERAEKERVEQELEALRSQLAASEAATQRAADTASATEAELRSRVEDREGELAVAAAAREGLERRLEGAIAEVHQLQSRLGEVQEQLAKTQHESSQSRDELSDRVTDLVAMLAVMEARAAQGESQAAQLGQELQDTRDRLGAEQQQLAERTAQLGEAQLEAQQRSEELAAVRSEVEQRLAELGELSQQLELRGQELEAKAEECADAQAQLSATAADLEARTADHAAAAARVDALSEQLSELRSQLTAGEQRCAGQEEELAKTLAAVSSLTEELAAAQAALQDTSAQLAAARQEAGGLAAREATSLDAVAALEERLAQSQRTVAELEQGAEELRAQLGSSRQDVASGEQRAADLAASLAAAEERVAGLEAQVAKLDAAHAQSQMLSATLKQDLQERESSVSQLEARVHELEATRTELRQNVEQLEAKQLDSIRKMSESEAASQRQIAQIEEQHQRDVQDLKNDLDNAGSEIKARDQQIVRTNFELRSEIDRLHAALDQCKRELAASKAVQEHMALSHQSVVAGMNERFTKQVERYNELSKKHDALRQQLDQAQREAESWKTKCERFDHAMCDVSRLIRFARNPPDSARSSLIMTRSEHLGGSRGGAVFAGTPTSTLVPLRITESPAASPRAPHSHHYAGMSPAGSKAASVTASRRLTGSAEDWGDEVHSRAAIPDVVSPGDQMPAPSRVENDMA